MTSKSAGRCDWDSEGNLLCVRGIADSNLRLGADYSERFREPLEASQANASTAHKSINDSILEYALSFVIH